MRLIQIDYFLEIAEKKSMTAAAKTLYISQPALSKQMALLEEELGIKLFTRKSRGIELTDAGRQFETDCRRILAEFENAKHQAIAIGKKEKKDLRIGCFEGILVDDFMQPIQECLRTDFPEIRLKMITRSWAENRKALIANKLDMIIELEPMGFEKNGFCRKRLISRKNVFAYSRDARNFLRQR